MWFCWWLVEIFYLPAECGCGGAGITDGGACSESGQCNCKATVTGLQCSQCVEGYWNLTTSNDLGCQGITLSCGDTTFATRKMV